MTEGLHLMAGGTCGGAVSPLSDRLSVLTTSLGVVDRGFGYVIDNGYGVQRVSQWVKNSGVRDVIMLQTHFHSDHVTGLSVNGLLFDKNIKIHGIWSPDIRQMMQIWEESFARVRWPVRPEDYGIRMPTQGNTMYLPGGILSMNLYHPGGCAAYRIPTASGDIVFATDHEAGSSEQADKAYAEFVSGAAILVCDMQYRQTEYEGTVGIGNEPAVSLKGRGHATPELMSHALSMCKDAPRKVLVTHHDKMRPQADLDAFGDEIRRVLAPVCKDVSLLFDGEELTI